MVHDELRMHFPRIRQPLRARLVVSTAILLASFAHACRGQTTEAAILTQLKDKPLFLRGCWHGDNLSFDHNGKPTQPYAPQSFTLSGIDVAKVRLGPDSLEIQGQRVGLEFGKRGPERVRLKWRHYNGKVVIRIAVQPGQEFGQALSAVFAPDLPTLIPSMEQYWFEVGKQYVRDSTSDDQAADENTANAADTTSAPPPAAPQGPARRGPMHVGASVKPPVLLSQEDPEFTDAARGMRYSANVEVYLWVGSSGIPEHLMVKKPAGLGLDEAAMAAVATYRFRPATQNGVPVKVDLYVDVNFRVF